MRSGRKRSTKILTEEQLIKSYTERKSEYEYLDKTDHPEYRKYCEWLRKNDI